jgi:hypothetical protein
MTVFAQLLGGTQAPRTLEELSGFIARRDELTGQLASLNDQRGILAGQIERLGSDPAVRNAPLERLRAIDARIAKLEKDIQASDELIAQAKANLAGREGTATVTPAPPPSIPDFPLIPPGEWVIGQQQPWRARFVNDLQTTAPAVLASVLLLGAVGYWWISRSVRGQLAKLIGMQSARLEELQRSVDTVAVEMERVSENQRYVTKLVGDKQERV